MKAQLPSTDKLLFKAAMGILISIWGLFILLFIGERLPWIGGPFGGLLFWIGLEFFLVHRHLVQQNPISIHPSSPLKKRFKRFFFWH